ncbi:hypothetical protein KUCAC02_031516, partial [Chaenocephalus aceratus]
ERIRQIHIWPSSPETSTLCITYRTQSDSEPSLPPRATRCLITAIRARHVHDTVHMLERSSYPR